MPTKKLHLEGIEETLLLPIWARAVESERPDAIVHDAKAVELIKRIDYDFGRFENDWKSQIAIAVRTRLIDNAVQAFLDQHPDAVIVNLGAGLDFRFFRLDNGALMWYELDLPEVIELRKSFCSESERYRMLTHSVLDFDWMAEIKRNRRSLMILAEGLLMYFAPQKVRSLICHLADAFPESEMILELLAFGAVGMNQFHSSLRRLHAPLKWSVSDSHELEKWHPGIQVVNEWCVLDHCRERWGWLAWVADNPWFRVFYGERIAHLRFQQAKDTK